jgi:hypothetical protein
MGVKITPRHIKMWEHYNAQENLQHGERQKKGGYHFHRICKHHHTHPAVSFDSCHELHHSTFAGVTLPTVDQREKSLVNPQMYIADRTNIGTILALMKYVCCGFHITTEVLELGRHNCQESTYCPHTTRNTMDEDLLHWDFKPVNTVGNIIIPTCCNWHD